MEIYKKQLVLSPVESRQLRIEQLQDEIDRLLVMGHRHDWAEARDINHTNWTINYPDGGMISMNEPTFTVLIGNREIQVENLDEAEDWLWDNFSADHYRGKEEPPLITCGACTTAIGAHTYSTSCKLFEGDR